MIKFFKKPVKHSVLKATIVEKLSYSQCGEDMIVDYVFRLRNITNPTYIDIGAHHPFYLNNTAFFYNNGCRGINIEANPELSDLFKLHRSKDINLNIGIDSVEGELDFYVMEDPSLSSFSEKERNNLLANGKYLKDTIKIKLTTIESILQKYYENIFPDFMSIDVEGMDFKILQSIDYEKYSPKIICVEAAEYSSIGAGARRNELIDFLVSKNYYEYANTNLNAIMVRKDFWFI